MVAVRSSDPVMQVAGDALSVTRYRASSDAEVEVPNALVVILCLTSVPTVERRSGGRSEVRQSRMGMVTVPDPSCSSTYTIRGGGNALFVAFPDVAGGAAVRPRFMASEPLLASLATRALALAHLGETGPLSMDQLRLGFDAVLFDPIDAGPARGRPVAHATAAGGRDDRGSSRGIPGKIPEPRRSGRCGGGQSPPLRTRVPPLDGRDALCLQPAPAPRPCPHQANGDGRGSQRDWIPLRIRDTRPLRPALPGNERRAPWPLSRIGQRLGVHSSPTQMPGIRIRRNRCGCAIALSG